MTNEKSDGFALLKLDGKPIEKLIETVSAGIGVLYKPRAMRKEAEAKAYELEVMAEAEAKVSIIKYDAESEIAERAKQRLYYQEMQRQLNIENIVDRAAQNLTDVVSSENIEEDWRTRFFIKAQDVTSEELQEVWGKILANEINRPGSFSVRTLETISNLSKKEADLFNKYLTLCDLSGRVFKLDSGNLEKYKIIYEDLLILRSAGLLHTSETLSIQCANYFELDDSVKLKILYNSLILLISKEKVKTFDLSCYVLTTAGVEILNVLNATHNKDYTNEFTEDLIKKGFTVEFS